MLPTLGMMSELGKLGAVQKVWLGVQKVVLGETEVEASLAAVETGRGGLGWATIRLTAGAVLAAGLMGENTELGRMAGREAAGVMERVPMAAFLAADKDTPTELL